MSNFKNRARYWWAVLWTENLPIDWKDTIADTVQLPFAYCVHDKDVDSKTEQRKPHVHVILAWASPTTYKNALAVFKSIGGDDAVNTCQAINNVRFAYDYLIHDTDTCRKSQKYQYEPIERICGNKFDIGLYEQVSQADKDAKLQEFIFVIHEYGFSNFADFTDYYLENYIGDNVAFEVYKTYSALLERITRGNYQREQEKREMYEAQKEIDRHQLAQEKDSNLQKCTQIPTENTQIPTENTQIPTENTTIFCPECGSENFVKIGKTAGGTQRFKCKHCGKKFVWTSRYFSFHTT